MPIGVLIPVRGFAPYLPETLDAVLAQGGVGALDVVVVDDGSADPVTLHPDHAARVRLVRRDEAGGPARARATALEHLGAGVELVALCDADDTWEPGALAATATALDREPRAGWAFGRARVVGLGGAEVGERWAQPAAGLLEADTFGRALYAANAVPTSSVVLRRGALAAAGGFLSAVRVAEDWELWLRLCVAGVAALCVPASVVRYRRHPGGLTADVAPLALAQLAVHERFAALVQPAVAREVVARDYAALAAGRARDGDTDGARAAWAQVRARRPLRRDERLRAAALAVPGLRTRLGRGDPYGR